MDLDAAIVIPAIFIGLPWLILHYMTKWKQGATITTDDEHLLEDLYALAKRLDERMNTVERLVASDHPGFERTRLTANREIESPASDRPLAELERLMADERNKKQGAAQ